MKILVVDDHVVVRQGLKLILAGEFTQAVFVEAENAQEALEQVRQTPFDLLVLDINMPGRSGLDVVGDLKKVAPKLRILVLSMYAEEQFALRVLRAGVNGYITKNTVAREFGRRRPQSAGGRYLREYNPSGKLGFCAADQWRSGASLKYSRKSRH